MADDSVPWSVAWQRAMTGPEGFYRSATGRAEDHFATEVMTGDAVAQRIIELVASVVRSVPTVTVTDVGAADGSLLGQLIRLWPAQLLPVTRWRGIDVRDRPVDLDSMIDWIVGDVTSADFRLEPAPGLVIAHELLDDVACDVVEPDEDGRLHLVLVDPATGRETIGPDLRDLAACAALGVDGAALADWCATWWPRTQAAARIEVGTTRDEVWRSISSLVSEGTAIAIDYSHLRSERAVGRWDGGTLTAYADGRPTRAVPDGSCNITAHVALDSCAAAVPRRPSALLSDRNDFRWLVQTVAPGT